MSRGQIIFYSVLGVVVIILIIFVFTIFHSRKAVDDSYKQQIEIKDSLIAAKNELIKAKEELNIEKDKSIALHEKNDSLLKTQTTVIKTRYEKIPVIVHDYSDQQLRDSAIAKYNSPN